ncbi:MAG: T9SS type A sorting domain-containing protein [Bacteroidota bacterium]|nr:T9SS type A sorting domain-containing protein [Bacteroidota bacterium]
MKKIMLTVAEPCHQNWESMNPQEQGRYCASCCKKVIDFTAMSDQQVLSFFEKKSEGICGRFYKDQLRRPITGQAKRFALPKHFFRYSWPAFLLFLKACNEKNNEDLTVVGALVEMPYIEKEPVVGDTVYQIMPHEPPAAVEKAAVTEHCRLPSDFAPPVTKGEAEVRIVADRKEQAIRQKDAAFVAVDTAEVDVQELSIVSVLDTDNIIMGMVAVSPHENKPIKKEGKDAAAAGANNPVATAVSLYPNPVNNGQDLTVRFQAPFSGSYQVYSISGQRMLEGLLTNAGSLQHNIAINRLVSGSYLIRFVGEAERLSYTVKFVVL